MSLALPCRNLELIPDFGSFRDILYGAAISYGAKKAYQHRKKIVNKKVLTIFYIMLFMMPMGVIEPSDPNIWDFAITLDLKVKYLDPSDVNVNTQMICKTYDCIQFSEKPILWYN